MQRRIKQKVLHVRKKNPVKMDGTTYGRSPQSTDCDAFNRFVVMYCTVEKSNSLLSFL